MGYSAELARRLAGAALHALRLVDDVRLLDRAGNRARRALLRAHRAALALRSVDLVLNELRALAGAALLVVDVLHVLVQYKIDPAKCKGCTMCARKCPAGAISGTVKNPHVIDQTKCIKCGACESTCKFGAISHG